MALSLCATVLFVLGCRKGAVAPQPGPSATVARTNVFQGNGIVVEVNRPAKSVTIRHQAISGYMGPMTMPFDVLSTNDLAGIEPGDPISFRLSITATEGWVDQIRITGPRTNILPTGGPVRFSHDVQELSTGDPLPEWRFTNEWGQTSSTAQYHGQALAIEFLFTRCPFPTFCPRQARNFAETQNRLLALTNGPPNWHLLTVTIDPAYDTPPVLRAYAGTYGYHSNHWTFATATEDDVAAFGGRFGLAFSRDVVSGLPNHNLRTVVVDAGGRVQDILFGNDWDAAELVPLILKAANAGK
jgi:protein SCO1/2